MKLKRTTSETLKGANSNGNMESFEAKVKHCVAVACCSQVANVPMIL